MITRVSAVLIGGICVLVAAGCSGEPEQSGDAEPAAGVESLFENELAEGLESVIDLEGVVRIELASAAFSDGETIPERHTCDGENVSPQLSWGEVPAGTMSFALIMDDPDAKEVAGKVWIHWVLYNVPPRAEALAEGVPREALLPGGARQVEGSSGLGYHGPCPPPDRRHRYYFQLFALDTIVDPNTVSSKVDLLEAIEGHVLGYGELMGEYERP
jgi:Raf kinase inhibitor-like YbhB/YbcL family protein